MQLLNKSRKATVLAKRLWHILPWQEISGTDYCRSFEEYGGSIDMHPTVISLLEELTGDKVRYFGLYDNGAIIAALPLWRSKSASVLGSFKHPYLENFIDLGEAELILPISSRHKIFIPFPMEMLSQVHTRNIINTKPSAHLKLMMARHHSEGEDRLSGKFLYNQRTQLRKFTDAGGRVQDSRELAPEALANAYIELFEAQWNKPPQGSKYLAVTFTKLKNLVYGSILWHGTNPAAVNIMYRHIVPNAVLAIGVNASTNPAYKAFSPGSILHFLNGQNLGSDAKALSRPMRFCFGKKDANYKDLWCREVPAYQT